MAGVNKVILLGNLGDKPALKYTTGGKAVTTLSVATSKAWVDKASGEKQEKTEWHRVSLFGKLAEIADKYCEKGTKVYIEGELQTNKYKNKKTGEDKYSTQIVVSGFNNVFQMVSGKGKDTTTAVDNEAPAKIEDGVANE